MTTAHRPTFDPAKGKEATRGPAYHQRLLPAHTHLKQRKAGQGGVGGLAATSSSSSISTQQRYGDAPPASARRDLRAELLAAEAAVRARKNGGVDPLAVKEGRDGDAGGGAKRKASDDDSDDATPDESSEDPTLKRRRLVLEEAAAIDAESDSSASRDNPDASDSSSTSSSSEQDSDDNDDESEDEEATLLAELAKIKAERAAARQAEEAAKAAREAEAREAEIARGNPLLNDEQQQPQRDFGVKRRWDDDVVFRNQGRGTEVGGKGGKGEFVNDLLRSDFHKRFMSKYVR